MNLGRWSGKTWNSTSVLRCSGSSPRVSQLKTPVEYPAPSSTSRTASRSPGAIIRSTSFMWRVPSPRYTVDSSASPLVNANEIPRSSSAAASSAAAWRKARSRFWL
jgi:hypothetical protein